MVYVRPGLVKHPYHDPTHDLQGRASAVAWGHWEREMNPLLSQTTLYSMCEEYPYTARLPLEARP